MMYSSTIRPRIHPGDYDLFVGMDVDKRSIAITTRDHLDLGKSLMMPHDADLVLSYFHNRHAGKRVAFVYEAGPTGFGLHDAIVAEGHTCLVVAPQAVPTARGKRVRTNRLDSIKLAVQLRGGQLVGIHVPAGRYRELRELTALRNSQIDGIRATKCRIKALLLRNSLEFPKAPDSGQWSKRLTADLRGLNCTGAVRFKLDSLLDELAWQWGNVLKTQLALRTVLATDEEFWDSMRYLMSVSGVGWVVASHYLARVGDWRKLGRSDETSSFIGLVPSEDSTGDRADRGRITKGGDKKLRSLLIQAAWVAIRKDSELREFYDRVYRSHPRNVAARVAIVAVARKLAVRMHCVLWERREYEIKPCEKEAESPTCG